MIKNIKLPVVVSTVKVMFNFVLLFEIDKMFIDLLSESCEEGLGGGGGISPLGNEDEPIFRG